MTYRLKDIVTDPSFAGLHWSIPRDTPEEDREWAHVAAALHAQWKRDLKRLRTHVGPYDQRTRTWLCCNLTDVEIAANQSYCELRKPAGLSTTTARTEHQP